MYKVIIMGPKKIFYVRGRAYSKVICVFLDSILFNFELQLFSAFSGIGAEAAVYNTRPAVSGIGAEAVYNTR